MHLSKTAAAGVIFSMWLALLAGGIRSTAEAAQDTSKLLLDLRSRVELQPGSGRFRVLYRRAQWEPAETAIIICDMWNKHWCAGATRRVAELAPVMNEVVANARRKGILIIHAPSGTMDYYRDHPGRKLAADAPKAANLPGDIGRWCNARTELEKRFEYPIDQSDGGCDCEPQCKQGKAWSRQIETIEIRDGDAVSDSGVEIWNLMEQRRIKNVVLMGVHTNMCVLGRPFGLRQMARHGKNVVLMRDLTDTMYNSRRRPFVSHFTGTDLIVEHIEKFVCPTITSTVFTGRTAFIFAEDKRPRVFFISAETEYGAVESLPVFADRLQRNYGLCCRMLQGSTGDDGGRRHEISGMEDLATADLVVVFVRRRAFQADQMRHLRDYLRRGRPLIGLRTASHAFDAKGTGPKGHVEWKHFDHDVLGGNYHGHYGRGVQTLARAAQGAEGHPILAGVKLPLVSTAPLYKAKPLAESARALLVGAIPGQEPEPVAWTNTSGKSRVFYTSFGSVDDFKDQEFCKMLVNAVFWAIDRPVPGSK